MKRILFSTGGGKLVRSLFKIAINAMLLLISATVFAQVGKNDLQKEFIIEGTIQDSNINFIENGETEVSVTISKYPFNLFNMLKGENHTARVKVKNNEIFKFKFPVISKRLYMSITYGAKVGAEYWQQGYDNIYIIEAGDRIKCVLMNDIFKFYGKGSEKLNCQSELYKVQIKFDARLMKIYQSGYTKRFEELGRLQDSCHLLRKTILEKYRPKLGKELYNIFQANLIGLRYFNTLVGIRTYATNANGAEYREYIKSKLYKEMDKNSRNDFDPEVLVEAPIYIDFLFEKIMLQTLLLIEGKPEVNSSPAHIKRVFDKISVDYTGIVRDKLFATFFFQWQSLPSIFDYYDDGLGIIKDSEYKKLVNFVRSLSGKGITFFPFELKDSWGKIVTLKDFKDKVVIVDFWYTGCLGCASLKHEMSGVWETYKNDPNVSFVSISIDKDVEQWKKSVLSKIYTEPEAINLYTNGTGKDHPIIKKLQINAYPRVYLLKNGKIYANPPYPSGADVSKGTTKKYIELIAAAIQSK